MHLSIRVRRLVCTCARMHQAVQSNSSSPYHLGLRQGALRQLHAHAARPQPSWGLRRPPQFPIPPNSGNWGVKPPIPEPPTLNNPCTPRNPHQSYFEDPAYAYIKETVEQAHADAPALVASRNPLPPRGLRSDCALPARGPQPESHAREQRGGSAGARY